MNTGEEQAALLNVTGASFHLRGEAHISSMGSSFTIHPASTFSGGSYAYFPNVTVHGVGTGLLVLEGGLDVLDGSLSGLEINRASMQDEVVLHTAERGANLQSLHLDKEFPESLDRAKQHLIGTSFAEIQVRDLVISNFSRAVLLDSGVATDLQGVIRIDGTGFLGVTSTLSGAGNVVVRAERFGLAGDFARSHLALAGEPDREGASAIFGRNATLQLGPDCVVSRAPFQVTQAIFGGELAFPALVDIEARDSVVTVEEGHTETVFVDYREIGNRSDAALDEIEISGTGSSLIRGMTPGSVSLVEDLRHLAGEDKVPLKPGFFCAIPEGCGYEPFPQWIHAGDGGYFFFEVRGDLPPGEYDAEITFSGLNYPEANIHLFITVVAV